MSVLRAALRSGGLSASGVSALQEASVNGELADHLKEVKRRTGCSSVAYVAINKDSHLLEVPEVGSTVSCLHKIAWKKGSCA